MKGVRMDDSVMRQAHEFYNLIAEKPRIHPLDETSGLAPTPAKGNPGHQMCYSAEALERELLAEGLPHVLLLACEGDPREPDRWALYADDKRIADGDGGFARVCFEPSVRRFLKVMGDAV